MSRDWWDLFMGCRVLGQPLYLAFVGIMGNTRLRGGSNFGKTSESMQPYRSSRVRGDRIMEWITSKTLNYSQWCLPSKRGQNWTFHWRESSLTVIHLIFSKSTTSLVLRERGTQSFWILPLCRSYEAINKIKYWDDSWTPQVLSSWHQRFFWSL